MNYITCGMAITKEARTALLIAAPSALAFLKGTPPAPIDKSDAIYWHLDWDDHPNLERGLNEFDTLMGNLEEEGIVAVDSWGAIVIESGDLSYLEEIWGDPFGFDITSSARVDMPQKEPM